MSDDDLERDELEAGDEDEAEELDAADEEVVEEEDEDGLVAAPAGKPAKKAKAAAVEE